MTNQIARSFILEQVRNRGILFGNLLPAFIFIICSWISKISLINNPDTVDYLIKGQFLPISLMMLLFTFSLSGATIYLADLKANKTYHWLKRTNVSPFTYYFGMGIGVFLLMNVSLVATLLAYALLIHISLPSFFIILLVCNFVFLAFYPTSFILAGIFKNGNVAQSMLVPILIIFMFSITMPAMFLTISGKNPQDYYIFLSWNPMLYLNDMLQYQLNIIHEMWLSYGQYAIILLFFSFVLSLFAKKIYQK
ncbi:hypothetical protein HNQ35_000497 [Cerasibacillus quisquiliarum]|uniref:ABC transporter permease n=1 Tax=Cerasibacillus quisquiliarum TaxID=227865 RepID=A0A511UT73_9BACI|nr:ABC transporter permease [Cerasibacillus quisquiliarum]MBB5145308.1 hypothetical protein [Cerasibacillus quisquiliarum]GEN29800.1 ABC transporter permease [Cerasibacillus quisquiliarum]